MSKSCRVSGCNNPVRSGLSTMCESHRQRWRRHGDPLQETISQKDIRPNVRLVERLIKRDTSGKIEAGLRQINTLLELSAQEVVSEYYHQGRPMNKTWVKANYEILKVIKGSNAIQIGITIAAVFLLQRDDPRRFVSDRGMIFQLVRKFRSLSDLNIGSYYNHETGKVTKVYKDLSAKVIEYMGKRIIEYYKSWVAMVIVKYESENHSLDEANYLIKGGFGI